MKWNTRITSFMMFVTMGCITFAGNESSASDAQKTNNRFVDFRDDPRLVKPPWTGPVFHLSQNYPEAQPAAEDHPWEKFNPRTQWREYLNSVLSYCYEGNIECDWEVQKNTEHKKWYHTPWLHWGRNGREFVHGLTSERVSQPGELAPTQVSMFQNWAIGMYNASGGYTIGKVWKDPDHPSAASFPNGTVTVKLLFTQASVAEVPYLKGSKEWQAHIYQSVAIPTNAALPRTIQTVRLLQIDVAVKDSQVGDKSGWVFGTFIYNGDRPGKTPWERMVPVGLMWGNDEGLTIAGQRAGRVPKETIINSGPELPFQHLGYAGRLNGPVDNPMSSCLSCHSVAQSPANAATIVPPREVLVDSPEWLQWFRTLPSDVPFTKGATPLGYSLQLAVGLGNYQEWKNQSETKGGFSATDAFKPFPQTRNGDQNPKQHNCSREGLPN